MEGIKEKQNKNAAPNHHLEGRMQQDRCWGALQPIHFPGAIGFLGPAIVCVSSSSLQHPLSDTRERELQDHTIGLKWIEYS